MVEESGSGAVAEHVRYPCAGSVALTKALLPAMRAAAAPHHRGVQRRRGTWPTEHRGLFGRQAALERWAESMAGEIAPFGLGVTVLIAGTYDTDIITDAGTVDERDFDGPYARMHRTIDKRGRFAVGNLARPASKFTDGLVRALDEQAPFRRRGVGLDASMLLVSNPLPAGGGHAPGQPTGDGPPASGHHA